MNRSYSKIRHIQEANQILERRLLSEQVTTNTTTIPVAGVSIGDVLKRFPQIPVSPNSPKKHTNGITVTWNEKPTSGGSGGVVTYYKDCNTGALTKYNGEVSINERNSRSVIGLELCRALIPNSQVVTNTDEYSKKQSEYTKDHPLQTGSPTHYRSDGSSTMSN